jgi:internalin A
MAPMTPDELLQVIARAHEDQLEILDLSGHDLTELPPEIGKLTQLKTLILGQWDQEKSRYVGNQLTTLPAEIANLTQLETLLIADNPLNPCPCVLFKLRHLRKLDLAATALKSLPPMIGNLSALTSLDLSDNQLTLVPAAIGDLHALATLDLSGNQLTIVPEAIGLLKHLTTLNLSGNQLTTVPAGIGHLNALTILDLSANQLQRVPETIGHLRSLTTLDLSENELTAVPATIGNLSHLRELSIATNQLTSVPAAIGRLNALTQLDLFSNQLIEVPSTIGDLNQLTTLSLENNQLTTVPAAIGRLSALITLDLENNQLTKIPETIGDLKNLITLDLENNQLTTVPAAIGDLSSLTTLDLRGNQLTTVPAAIGDLSSLTTLDLSGNQLARLPDEIGRLSALTTLNLFNNQLVTVPEAIGRLKNLTTLYLFNNQLTALPDVIGDLSALTTLYLSANQLTRVPDVISRLRVLTRLNLSHNHLTSVPDAISPLTALTELSLSHNPLTKLPPWLQSLTQLRKLDLLGTELPIPPEVLGTDWHNLGQPADILAYYFSLQHTPTRPLNEVKVLLVGQGSVGKTSLAERLLRDQYDPHQRKTEGIQIQPWMVPINEHTVQINLWDFGGQEIMHATHQFFLTQRSLYLLVINNRQTEAENRIEYWLNLIQSLGGDSPIILVGNKTDEHALDLDQPGLQAKYPQLRAFIPTSCSTGDGIPALKGEIIQHLSTLPHIHDLLPLSWFTLKQQLETLHRDYIPYRDYEQMCAAVGITQDRHQQTLIRFLHDLGVVLNFEHDRLQDTNVLNPEWVTNGIYKILNHNALITEHRGILPRSLIGEILDHAAYPPSKHLFILDMMQQFELCFALEADRQWLIPDLLPKAEPDTGDWSTALALQYDYNILPQSIISRFIVRMSAVISHHTYWRTGVVLASADGNRALVKADLYDQKIFIWVDGNPHTRRAFLTAIRTTLGQIHSSLSRLQAKEKVPLPNHPHVVVDYHHLLTLERKNIREFIPEGLAEAVTVRHFLESMERLEDDREECWEEQERNHDRKPKFKPDATLNPEVFISYAWGGESEALVDRLDQTLKVQGITLIRDKRDLGFKGLIKEFMQRIGRGRCVIAVISDKYLKSPNCMFELAEVAENGQFYDRIFPIVLSDAQIHKPVPRLAYIKHWDLEIQALDAAMKEVSQDNLQGIREEMDLYRRIRTTIAELTATLKNMNTLTPEIHSESEFAALIGEIVQRLAD